MVDKNQVKEEVRSALKKQLAPKETNVDLTESQKEEFQQTIVEEGFGRALAKTLAAGAGAVVGGALGGNLGALSGAAATFILSALGLVSTSAIVPAAVAASVGGGLAFMYYGVKIGMRSVDVSSGSDTTKVSLKLAKTTEERDELISIAAKNPDDAAKYSSRIDKLTQEQMQFGKELEKSIRRDLELNMIDATGYQTYQKVVDAAKKGKLTYIKK